MTLVLNMFMAPIFLKEKLTWWDIFCTILILMGTILALCFGDKNNMPYTLNDLIDLYTRLEFLIFVGIFFLGVILMVIFLWRSIYRLQRPPSPEYDEHARNIDHRYVLFAYPSFGGFAGAASVLFAKSAIEMAKSSMSGRSPTDVQSPIFALFLLGAGLAIWVQCLFLNKGLEKGDALFIVPVYQVSWVFTNTMVGLIYFRDYWGMTKTQISVFATGVVIALVGVYLLSLREKAKPVGTSFADSATSVNADGSAEDLSKAASPVSAGPNVAVAIDESENTSLLSKPVDK